MTELELWSIMCQSSNGGAGRWQRIVTTAEDYPFIVESLLPTPHSPFLSSARAGHAKAEALHRTQSSPLLAHWSLHIAMGEDHFLALTCTATCPLAPGWALPEVSA